MAEAQARRVRFAEINVGDVYAFEKSISREDVLAYARLSGDWNPLHVDEEYGRSSPFERNLAHGMFVGSLFSTLISMHATGEKSLYISQTLHFRSPVFYGDTITVRGTVLAKNEGIRLVTLRTDILKKTQLVITGEAKIKMLADD